MGLRIGASAYRPFTFPFRLIRNTCRTLTRLPALVFGYKTSPHRCPAPRVPFREISVNHSPIWAADVGGRHGSRQPTIDVRLTFDQTNNADISHSFPKYKNSRCLSIRILWNSRHFDDVVPDKCCWKLVARLENK